MDRWACGFVPIGGTRDRLKLGAMSAANLNNADHAGEHCLHEAFSMQARLTPEAVAVTMGPESLTYRELDNRTNALACRLRALGVGPEIRVALYLERTPGMVIAIIAVLKAGGCYVPVDLAYPKDRLSFMLQDSEAAVLITQENLRESLPTSPASVVCIDSPELAGESAAEAPAAATTSENAAYIIYTSGSTGAPKGVIVTHRNVLRLITETDAWYGFNSTDVWPLFHSYAFDVSVWEIWGSLLHGGRLVVVPYLTSRSPRDFYELLVREGVTVLNQTPSAFRQLIRAEEEAGVRRELKLRYVICAGEALELQSLKPWFERHGDERPLVVNMYGITETTVHSMFRPIRQIDLTSGAGSVIGVPIPDLQIHLVDENLKPVPDGEAGEICVAGAGVARGYNRRPELTAQRFLPDPFSAQAGAQLYRSGDLARRGAGGELEYLGRIDHQVKIRGFRVELGEIESWLNRHPAIRESVVVAREAPEGDRRLAAYLVSRNGIPTATELRRYLEEKIPDYMVPAWFTFLPSLPLTNNGKVDRRALPEPDQNRPRLQQEYAAPRGDAEQMLAEIWKAALGLREVGRDDNYFELGGDSIRSIAILARARERGLDLSLEQMLEHPTVAGMAECASAKSGTRAEMVRGSAFDLVSSADRGRLPADLEDAYPLARLQLGMFYHNEMNPASAVYHDVFSYRIHTAFDWEKLDGSLHRVSERHPILRTSFHLGDFSEPLQLVHSRPRLSFDAEDLRNLPAPAQERAIRAWIDQEKRKPFNRSAAPLVRFHVYQLAEKCFQFVISFHHACLDGWSLAALLAEILEDYGKTQGRGEAVQRPLRLAYRNFLELERQACGNEASRKFWAAKVADAPSQVLPRWPESMRENGTEQHRGTEIEIPAEVLAGLKNLARTAGVPLKTVLLAAHLRVMAFACATEDVVSGLLCNGRPEELDGENVLGLFLNTLPLRMGLHGGTWTELVRQTFAAERELVPHRRFPLSEIQKMNGGRAPFEAAFDFVHFHVLREIGERAGIAFEEGPYFEANNLTAFTTFILDATSGRLGMHIDFDPTVLCREQIDAFNAYYLKTLQAMAGQPDARYDEFSPMPEAERNRVVKEWNHTVAEYPRHDRIHELFEARARRTPDAVAVVCDGEQVTYRELNRRSDDTAQRLIDLHVGRGSLVGICLDRSVDMVAGLLGILKAGAAYVPLDPVYPTERLSAMLHEARVRVLLTQRKLLERLPVSGAHVLSIDAPPNESPYRNGRDHHDSELPEERTASPRDSGAVDEPSHDLAYVIFTSGSTGRPKGVQVTHRSVVNLLVSAAKTLEFGPADNLLAVTTLSFDIAGLELFMPLVTGGRVTIATAEEAADPTRLAVLIESTHATVMQATPTQWRILIEAGWTGSRELRVICGGEALDRKLADELLARVGAVWNFYGPTESTIWSTAAKVSKDGAITIGRPLANTSLYVLDAARRLLPTGTIGELCIGGDGVARGYLNQPELTSEKFVPDPYSHDEPARLYRTGDLARYRPDGQVECLGRVDHQVKIRGFRIELGDIEAALQQNPGVAEVVVSARKDSRGEKKLVAYVISRNGPLALEELRNSVRLKLPAYMIPAHFVQLTEFPRTLNGKTDIRRLPAPDTGALRARNVVPPRDETERVLAEIWCQVLEIRSPGVFDDFFESGGDSLSATRVFARINQRFSCGLTLPAVFENPTISALAELVRKTPAVTGVRSAPVRRRARMITFAQPI